MSGYQFNMRGITQAGTVDWAVGGGTQSLQSDGRPLVTVVLPAFNESAILEKNLSVICRYLDGLQAEYRWEVIVVNDGSRDETGKIAESVARRESNIVVIHHPTNFGLGQALRTGFNHSHGDYVVVLDMDLSYAPDHIALLLEKIRRTYSKVVVAAPYAEGGRVSAVPWLRKTLSVWGNKFLSSVSRGDLSTLTGMVRVYDGPYIRAMSLRAIGMEINPEILYKSMLLRARIEEVPAHLDWTAQNAHGPSRQSSMRLLRHVVSTVLSGFVFRPFMFFILPGMGLLAFALYTNVWMFLHFFEQYWSATLPPDAGGLPRMTAALAAAYALYPHTFVVGLLALMLAIQLISLGVLSLQSKKYFEDMFFVASGIYRSVIEQERSRHDKS
jgi:glycosyltransferase involved in cell wall biosynthesis